jgi:hypothetical protein
MKSKGVEFNVLAFAPVNRYMRKYSNSKSIAVHVAAAYSFSKLYRHNSLNSSTRDLLLPTLYRLELRVKKGFKRKLD